MGNPRPPTPDRRPAVQSEESGASGRVGVSARSNGRKCRLAPHARVCLPSNLTACKFSLPSLSLSPSASRSALSALGLRAGWPCAESCPAAPRRPISIKLSREPRGRKQGFPRGWSSRAAPEGHGPARGKKDQRNILHVRCRESPPRAGPPQMSPAQPLPEVNEEPVTPGGLRLGCPRVTTPTAALDGAQRQESAGELAALRESPWRAWSPHQRSRGARDRQREEDGERD
ncbi:uncharacterized protein [Lepisosteus oculatus]|uniref:uncharacterized protein n=1 Tax=Lepisosteus oculatus TaxID=7918 RepID=UPI0037162856